MGFNSPSSVLNTSLDLFMNIMPIRSINIFHLKVQHATMQQGLLIVGDDQGSLFALGANGEIEWQTRSPDGAGKVVRIYSHF